MVFTGVGDGLLIKEFFRSWSGIEQFTINSNKSFFINIKLGTWMCNWTGLPKLHKIESITVGATKILPLKSKGLHLVLFVKHLQTIQSTLILFCTVIFSFWLRLWGVNLDLWFCFKRAIYLHCNLVLERAICLD